MKGVSCVLPVVISWGLAFPGLVAVSSLPAWGQYHQAAPTLGSAASRQAPPARGSQRLAVSNRHEVTVDEFVGFVDRVRGVGYRPASYAEAERLLLGAIRETEGSTQEQGPGNLYV